MHTQYLYIIFLCVSSLCEAYKILVVFPFPLRSHTRLGDALVNALLEAEHEVTYVTPYPEKDKLASNLTQVDVGILNKHMESKVFSLARAIEETASLGNDRIHYILQPMQTFARDAVANENVQKFLKDPTQEFDLVVAGWMFSELYAGFSAVYQCPFIWVSSMVPHGLLLHLGQLTANPEILPNLYTRNVRVPLSFPQRLQEFIFNMKTSFMKTVMFNGIELENYKKFFVPIISKRGLAVPMYEELASNASLVMVNSHVALASTSTAALPPNYVSIGSYHIDDNAQIKALSEDLQRIMDDAEHGVIYFSMGSYLVGSQWAQYLIRELLGLFRSLNHTVLWKLDIAQSDLPENVHILPWAPQQSILKHPKCSLFITHGGILSMTEAVHFGVPVIVIPIFGDQYLNAVNAEKKGFGKLIDLSRHLTGDLKVTIKEVIGNSKYKEKAKQLSLIYHDQTPPKQRLVAWVDFVVRTRGAAHLSSALLLPWYQQIQQWYLDMIIPCVITIILPLTLLLRCK